MEYSRGNDPYFSQFNVILMSIAVLVPALMWFFKNPKGRRAYIAPGQVPILGHAQYFHERELIQFNEKMTLKAKFQSGEPDYEAFVLGKRFLFISTWEVASELLKQRPIKFRRDRSFENWAHDLKVMTGLFNAEDPDWGRIRRLTASSFSGPSVKAISSEIFEQTKNLIADLRSASVANKDGIVDGLLPFKRFAATVIFAMAFGSTVHEFEYVRSGQLYKDLDKLLLWMFKRTVNPFPIWLHRLLHSQLEADIVHVQKRMFALIELVLERDRSEEGKGSMYLQMLRSATLKEAGGRLSLSADELIAQIFTTLIAGTETTSVSIECALWVLGQPQFASLQAEVQAEVDALLPGTAGVLEDIDRVDALPLLTAVVWETLRLHGPGRMLFLQTSSFRDAKLPCDYILSPNDEAVINLTGIMLDETIFHNPNDFNPKRWLPQYTRPEQLAEMHARFLAFGSGPRVCPGQRLATVEMVSSLAAVIKAFHVKLACDQSHCNFVSSFTAHLDKLPLILTPRSLQT